LKGLEENEGEHYLPWPEQSSHLNIIELFRSVLEARVRSRFQPPTPLKKLEGVQQGERCKIPLEAIKMFTSPFARNDWGSVEGKRWSNSISIEECVRYLY
jgi:hypothetical protein